MRFTFQHPIVSSVVFISLFVFLLSSCNTTRQTTELNTTANDVAEDASAFMLAAAQNQFQADWLLCNAQLSYDDGSMAVGATASIKIQKDVVIWMSIKKFGFELGRAKITPDSIYILDRFNNQYAIEPLSFIEEKFGLPASLSMLQQIFMGNPVFLTTSNPKGDLKNNIYRLSATSDTAQNEFWFTMPDYTMKRMEISQESQNRSLSIHLEDYKDAGGNRDFSYLRKISVNSAETGQAQIEIQFSKIEINVPTDIRFSIPPRYTRMAY